MPSDFQTGSLLRTLISSKPNGPFLELGTGTGLSLSWIVEAMDENSKVLSIDNNEAYQLIAKEHFDADFRVTIICHNPIGHLGHQDNVVNLISYLDTREDLKLTKMNWSTGLIIATKVYG